MSERQTGHTPESAMTRRSFHSVVGPAENPLREQTPFSRSIRYTAARTTDPSTEERSVQSPILDSRLQKIYGSPNSDVPPRHRQDA